MYINHIHFKPHQVAAAHSVRDFHPSEYLGMLGLFGAIITLIQVRAVIVIDETNTNTK